MARRQGLFRSRKPLVRLTSIVLAPCCILSGAAFLPLDPPSDLKSAAPALRRHDTGDEPTALPGDRRWLGPSVEAEHRTQTSHAIHRFARGARAGSRDPDMCRVQAFVAKALHDGTFSRPRGGVLFYHLRLGGCQAGGDDCPAHSSA